MKVKSFEDNDHNILTEEMNNFFTKNPNIDIMDIKMVQSGNSYVMCFIFYKDRKDKINTVLNE